MRKILPATFGLLLLWIPLGPALAGTALKARFQNDSYKAAWLDLDASIDDGHLRLDFTGPSADGSLIYDQETSKVLILDHFHKTVLELDAGNQQGVKLLLAVGAGRLDGKWAGANQSERRAYTILKEDARAFFNGTPRLLKKDLAIGGMTCDEYEAEDAGTRMREVWVTTPRSAGMDGQDYGTLRGLAHLVVDLGGSLLTQWGADTDSFQQALNGTPLPVKAVYFMNGKALSRFQVTSLRPQSFAADLFNPPSDYKVLGLLDLVSQGGR